MPMRVFRLALALLLWLPAGLQAQQRGDAECGQPDEPDCPSAGSRAVSRSFGAVKAYISAPLHWRASDWLYFGGAIAAIGVAHHYDSQVRTHFTADSPSAISSANAHTLQDAVP